MKLAELQRLMAADIMRPLNDRAGMAKRAGYVRPNGRLSCSERLEIYSRSYWYRLLDAMYEDFPGLRAIVGDRKFTQLAEAYLAECPSTSYTMRNLGSKLEAWLRSNPLWAGREIELALDMIRLEWAHIEAFDEAEWRVIGPEDLAEFDPRLRLALQPYVRLLKLQYPVDGLRIQVNDQYQEEPDVHTATSNTVVGKRAKPLRPRVARLRKEPLHLAVHRNEGSVYYRRLEQGEFAALESLARGGALEKIVTRALRSGAVPMEEFQAGLEGWVAAWSQLGWLCHPPVAKRSSSAKSPGQ